MHSAFLALIDSESDKHKFEQIYEKYKNKVYNLAYKRLNDLQYAEDATQETFFRIAKNIEDYHDIDSAETEYNSELEYSYIAESSTLYVSGNGVIDRAFGSNVYGATSAKKVVISGNITAIGDNAFAQLSNKKFCKE